MPALDIMPEKAHQPPMSPSHRGALGWDATGAPTPMHKRLDGKVAIVTGGARGIGEAIVRLFVKHGAKVVIADIDEAAGEALAASLGPHSVAFVRCDVSVEEDVERAVDRAVSRHGRLDVFCNNAGILGRQTRAAKSILSFDAAEFDRVLRVNALGTALGLKHAGRAMVPRRQGSIVSVASVAGVLGGLGPHAYTASKHAIVGLTKNAACELGAHGVRVNCVSPFGSPMQLLLRRHGTELLPVARSLHGCAGVRDPSNILFFFFSRQDTDYIIALRVSETASLSELISVSSSPNGIILTS